MRIVRSLLRASLETASYLALALVLVLLASPSTLSEADRFDVRLSTIAPLKRFDLVSWVIRAFAVKTQDRLTQDFTKTSEAERQQLVERYFTLAREEEELRGKLLQRRAQAAPAEELTQLEEQLARKRDDKLALERQTEAIVANWVEGAARAEGLVEQWPLFPQLVFPPTAFKFVAPPLLLVMSARDKIETKKSTHLAPGLSLSEQEAIEGAAEERLGIAALVVGLGGVGTYPTMVLETSSYEWTLEVVSHEWTHNYLDIRPLGMNYSKDNHMRSINETTANFVGRELAHRIRGLPPPSYEDEPEQRPTPRPTPKPDEFNFNREMRETYEQATALLKEGRIVEAEAYMEERRKLFVARGYTIRKLNQAYFAFYGSYADGGFAGSVNPIGGELRRLRRVSGSLKAYLDALARVSSFEEYRALLREKGVPEGKR
jgi:hypothetical protein